jgi:CHASE2 domain/CHAT domain
MMNRTSILQLTVSRIDQTCLFELAWGQAQRLKAQIDYPNALSLAYREWQRIYLSFYQANLLGKVESSGTIELPDIDWHKLLVQAEVSLLSEFNQWLRQSELYEIRSAIRATEPFENPSVGLQIASPLDVFLTCTPIELERLPWEAWELWAESSMIQVVRTPANIRHESVRRLRQHPRLLVIIGADERNKFTRDLQVVKNQFKHIAQVKVIGWQLTAQDIPDLKRQIWEAIAALPGWDALLFFGHSNESALTGGELAIAPNTWISIRELTPQLLKAKEHGLQFALFNSCSGLNIAESLISLGLGQVVIMREPIHNAVAQHFLIHFLQKLADRENVHQALRSACRNLLDQKLIYPSAAIIPSLFCYPNAPLFQLEPIGWKQSFKGWMPTRQELIFTGALAFLSLLWPVQDGLLDLRMLAQAVYRDVDHEIAAVGQTKPSVQKTSPILLVQVDDESLRRNNIVQRRPMDRAYLAKLVNRLATLKPGAIGIDYVLDEPQPRADPILAQSIQNAARQNIQFVLASFPNGLDSLGVDSQNKFLDPRWSFPGSIEGAHRFIPLVPVPMNCKSGCPFAQTLAIASRQSPYSGIASLPKQPWLTPINDLSIPPDQVFQPISSSQVLAKHSEHWSQLKLRPLPIIIIAPGGYAEAGVRAEGEDNLPIPWVVNYWRSRLGRTSDSVEVFTGGEAHAYRVYQLLNRKWVILIPDFLLIVCAAILGKQIQLCLKQSAFNLRCRQVALALMTGGYGFFGLQLYISAGVLCPWLFPSATIWYYIFPVLKKKSDAQAQK